MNMVDTRSGMGKFKDFLVTNCWLFWVLLVIQNVWTIYVDVAQNEKIDTTVERFAKMTDSFSRGVVMLDMMGRPISVLPTQITPANTAFKEGISNYIKMNGLFDWAKLTNNFTKKIRTLDELYQENPDVGSFKKDFFTPRTKAIKDFEAYLTAMIFAMNNNKLPEHIGVVDEKIEKFVTEEDEFSIEVNYTVSASIYDGNTDSYSMREGNIVVKATGVLLPSKGTPNNPLGIFFTKEFKPTVLSK